ncbi:MAG TPA: hypothetical protein VJ483_00430 [Holophagaceae bacterium]|nr:hypothetical protein [Holophagaceae bacterium]
MPLHRLILGAGLALALPLASLAAQTPTVRDGVTIIHLDQYAGYFASQETLAGLKPGTYEFVVTNKAGRQVGFQVQDLKTGENLVRQGLAPGETKHVRATITAHGFRYRCPVNPTPWYDIDTVSE